MCALRGGLHALRVPAALCASFDHSQGPKLDYLRRSLLLSPDELKAWVCALPSGTSAGSSAFSCIKYGLLLLCIASPPDPARSSRLDPPIYTGLGGAHRALPRQPSGLSPPQRGAVAERATGRGPRAQGGAHAQRRAHPARVQPQALGGAAHERVQARARAGRAYAARAAEARRALCRVAGDA